MLLLSKAIIIYQNQARKKCKVQENNTYLSNKEKNFFFLEFYQRMIIYMQMKYKINIRKEKVVFPPVIFKGL